MKLIMENWRKFINEAPVQSQETTPDSNNEEAFVNFIVRSNEIEGYKTPEDEISEALEGLQQGYPLRYVAQNPHIYSHLAGIESAKRGFSSVEDILDIHRAMGQDAIEAGSPGSLRSSGARSEHGTEYVAPEHVPEALEWWTRQKWPDPFEAHTVYELIHPFDDGNGRSGRIILAAMLGFNYSTVNNLIDKSYFSNLDKIGQKYQGEFWKSI